MWDPMKAHVGPVATSSNRDVIIEPIMKLSYPNIAINYLSLGFSHGKKKGVYRGWDTRRGCCCCISNKYTDYGPLII